MKSVSIITPCHNEGKNISPLVKEIKENIPRKYSFEIILVDDGSSDDTESSIEKECNKDKRVRGIILHRNFGHQMALLAGIKAATGDAIVMMDADFQHPPKLIPLMLNEWEKKHDLVRMIKRKSDSGFIRKLGYNLWQWISRGMVFAGSSDFRLIDRKIGIFLAKSTERVIFLRGLVSSIARNPVNLTYQVGKRKFGSSSYSYKMFFNLFVNGIISFSTFPLRIASITGLIMTTGATFFLGGDIIFALITHTHIVKGYTTLVLLTIMLNGFVIFYLGIVGEYIGVIFREVKRRPKYIIERTLNIKK